MATKHELHQKGLRLTPQRGLVLAAVRSLGHATPEEVAEKVRQTTYHAAEELTHLHLVCSDCGDIGDAPTETAANFVNTLSDDFGFKTDVTHFAIYGLCAKCADIADKRK